MGSTRVIFMSLRGVITAWFGAILGRVWCCCKQGWFAQASAAVHTVCGVPGGQCEG